MTKIISNVPRSTRVSSWTVALAAGAIAAVTAAATPAAAGPQATSAQIDNSLNYHAAAPYAAAPAYPSGAYDAATTPRRHQSSARESGPYASQQPTTPTPPRKNFQDYK